MRRFSLVDKIIVVLVLFLCVLSLGVTHYKIPLWKMVLEKDFSLKSFVSSFKHQEPIGHLSFKEEGELTRKRYGQYSYDVLSKGDAVYAQDFIVNRKGAATITFKNGETINIGPNSSLMLSLESDESKMNTDVFRASKIQIFSGTVETPTPEVKIVEKIKIVEKVVEKEKIVPGPERIVEKIVEVEKPLIELKDLNLEDPLISGTPGLRNSAVEDKVKSRFFVELRWGGDLRANRFEVQSSWDNKNFKTILNTTNSVAQVMNSQLFSGRVFFKVLAYKDKVLINQSPVRSASFEFVAPVATKPEQGSVFSKKSYLTWSKTSFTKEYEVELSFEETFQKSKTVSVSQNFFEANLRPGQYYWRVRSKSGRVQSSWSEVRSFNVQSITAKGK